MNCTLCPRNCKIDRSQHKGFCGQKEALVLARAALHFWEEPCISGSGGSGTVFFSGCNLRCVFCQNRRISADGFGEAVTVKRLREIFEELVWQGADNINLVTPTHFAAPIAEALDGFSHNVPVIWNSGGYDSVQTLKMLEGKIDIYMPDFKYSAVAPAKKYSAAADYPFRVRAALKEMYRQVGDVQFDDFGMLQKGLLVRHLVLPGELENTYGVIDTFASLFPDGQALFSLMGQYTPPAEPLAFENLNRKLTEEEYEKAEDYLYLCGIEDGFVQELTSAEAQFTPPFDLTGVQEADLQD
ncbi:MAG: 4Fe-4S cluster-binding domain-containing protein [Ruminococcaceae bacterium]|nr:4Fe-4S cluster-binding domain-containing protein [Oscillospiraceae bacterium]